MSKSEVSACLNFSIPDVAPCSLKLTIQRIDTWRVLGRAVWFENRVLAISLVDQRSFEFTPACSGYSTIWARDPAAARVQCACPFGRTCGVVAFETSVLLSF